MYLVRLFQLLWVSHVNDVRQFFIHTAKPKNEFTQTFLIRSCWIFAVRSFFTGSSASLSLLVLAFFVNDNSRSVLHLASITDLELLTPLHKIFAMTLAMPWAESGFPSSSCNEPAMSSFVPVSFNKYNNKMCNNTGQHDMQPSLQFQDCIHPLGSLELNIWPFDI